MIKVEPKYLFLARRRILRRVLLPLFAVLPTVAGLVGCGEQATQEADHYNDLAYYYHYRSLDSTTAYARRALQVARGDDGVIGESLNNLAFVAIMRMDFPRAKQLCDSVNTITGDQIELLVSDILQMRICQRESRNKDFYDSYQQAAQRLRRIDETSLELTPRQQRRMVYARSEYRIVASAYFYYVGLDRQSAQAISGMGEEDLASDTAQLINYWYCYGAGGLLTKGSREEIYQQEFDCLMRAYRLAMESRSTFWIANTLQALSEHLLQRPDGPRLMADNPRDIRLINTDAMPDSLLAGNLAERSLHLFRQFGDIYQKAGSLRTLANCYWQIDDYHSALICLEKALEEDTVINRAPDLVASIREQLCIVYSAVDDKQASDYNRNLYLDLQDQTRQDRYYEARADQLDRTSHTLNLMLAAVGFMILLMAGLLGLFAYLRSRGGGEGTIAPLQASLKRWKERDEEHQRALDEQYEEVAEQLAPRRGQQAAPPGAAGQGVAGQQCAAAHRPHADGDKTAGGGPRASHAAGRTDGLSRRTAPADQQFQRHAHGVDTTAAGQTLRPRREFSAPAALRPRGQGSTGVSDEGDPPQRRSYWRLGEGRPRADALHGQHPDGQRAQIY